MEKKKIVFLYTEIATYFLACVKALAENGFDVIVVHWPVNKEAPFQFQFPEGISFHDRKSFVSDEQLLLFVEAQNPSVIYCSGWVDRGYLGVCRKYNGNVPVVVGLDNQWTGSLRQHLSALVSPLMIRKYFSHCWVPGSLQEAYALKLGFRSEKILKGVYSCDFDFFYAQYQANKVKKAKEFPKRFIFVGRYYEFKGVTELWETFAELSEEFKDWELWCLGKGDIEPFQHPAIKHFGFVQPGDMEKYIKNTGVFVLPSHFEPWGVVVHEFAAAGFPLVCSDAVGARVAFVGDDYNGYIYKAGNRTELKSTLRKIMSSDAEKLSEMASRSVEKAEQIKPTIWTQQLISLIK